MSLSMPYVCIVSLRVYACISYVESDLKLSVARLSVNRLDLTQQVTLDNILSLLNVRTGVSEIEIFSLNQVNTMINYLSTD